MKKLILLLSCLLTGISNAQPAYAWAKGMGGPNDEQGLSIAVDAIGNVYTMGYFEGVADFDPGAGTYTLSSVAGSRDIYVSKLDPNGNFIWAKGFGSDQNEQGEEIAVDATGNVFVAGYFLDTVDFDPGVGTFSIATINAVDAFVSKLDPSGNFVWAKIFGGTNNQYARSLTVDAAGNVYTTGVFAQTVDFDPGPGTYTLNAGLGSTTSVFISKLDGAGNFVMAKKLGGNNSAVAYSIKLDAAGNIYTTGNFGGTVDFDPNLAVYNYTAVGSSDCFVSKLDGLGNFIWASQLGGSGYSIGESIAIDATGNVHIAGSFSGVGDFDPSVSAYTYTASGFGTTDPFLWKLDVSGNLTWAVHLLGLAGGDDTGKSIGLDNSGNVYSTGRFVNSMDFDPGPGTFSLSSGSSFSNVYISKLNSSGNFVWAGQVGGTSTDEGHALALDAAASIYLTGSFANTADFDPGVSVANLTAPGTYNSFILKLAQPGSGINENVKADNILLYPNPNNGEFNISGAEGTIEIINAIGQTVYTSELNTAGENTIKISGLASGIYYLKTERSTFIKKIIIN